MEYLIPIVLIGAIGYFVFFKKGAGGGCCGGGSSEEPKQKDKQGACH